MTISVLGFTRWGSLAATTYETAGHDCAGDLDNSQQIATWLDHNAVDFYRCLDFRATDGDTVVVDWSLPTAADQFESIVNFVTIAS